MTIAFVSRLDPAFVERWLAALRRALPKDTVTADTAREAEIAVVANPAPGALAGLPRLRFIQSAWAGVETLLADCTIPEDLPLARVIDPELADSMAEAVLLHVLHLHRLGPLYTRQQRERTWIQHPQPPARERRVGVMGLGEMGMATVRRLLDSGFQVSGWSRSGGAHTGVEVFAGEAGLAPFLGGADVVVNLLPLTVETRGILSARTFAAMREGAALINVARGGHMVTADVIAALDDGRLGHAVLDVFEEEPLPESSPLWSHPKVTLWPHVAARTYPETAAFRIAANIARFRAGEPVEGLVDRKRGY